MTKQTATLIVYLSKIDKQLYVGVDGNLIDLKQFGIRIPRFKMLQNAIEKCVKDVIGTSIEMEIGNDNKRHSK